MSRALRVIARAVAALGLGAIAALHAVWVTGSSWPAQDRKRLGEAVVGQTDVQPAPLSTAVVAAGAAGAGLVVAGAFGDGRLQRLGLRGMGAIMLLRAAFGGEAALAVLGLPPAGDLFRRLDARYYRPFAAVLGLALWIATLGRRRRPDRG